MILVSITMIPHVTRVLIAGGHEDITYGIRDNFPWCGLLSFKFTMEQKSGGALPPAMATTMVAMMSKRIKRTVL